MQRGQFKNFKTFAWFKKKKKTWQITLEGNYQHKIIVPDGSAVRICLQSRRCKRQRCNQWIRKITKRTKHQPTPLFLTRESHGQRSLEGYSAKGCEELDTTDYTQTSKTHSQHHSQWWRLKMLPLRLGDTWECSVLPLLCNTALRVLAITVRKDRHRDRQINQWHFKLKRGRIIYVQAWHDLKCRNPKYATRKNVISKKLMKQSNKDIHKCQCWKSVALLYINDQSEKEMKKTVVFTIVSGRINYFMINWTKKGKTCTVQCQTLWIDSITQILFSRIGRLIAKISILTIAVYNSNAILIKTPP